MPENFTMETARAAAVSALVVDTILLCGGRYVKVHSTLWEDVRGECSKYKKQLLNSLCIFQRLRGSSAGLLRGVQLIFQSLDASLQTPGSQVCTAIYCTGTRMFTQTVYTVMLMTFYIILLLACLKRRTSKFSTLLGFGGL